MKHGEARAGVGINRDSKRLTRRQSQHRIRVGETSPIYWECRNKYSSVSPFDIYVKLQLLAGGDLQMQIEPRMIIDLLSQAQLDDINRPEEWWPDCKANVRWCWRKLEEPCRLHVVATVRC